MKNARRTADRPVVSCQALGHNPRTGGEGWGERVCPQENSTWENTRQGRLPSLSSLRGSIPSLIDSLSTHRPCPTIPAEKTRGRLLANP